MDYRMLVGVVITFALLCALALLYEGHIRVRLRRWNKGLARADEQKTFG